MISKAYGVIAMSERTNPEFYQSLKDGDFYSVDRHSGGGPQDEELEHLFNEDTKGVRKRSWRVSSPKKLGNEPEPRILGAYEAAIDFVDLICF